MSKQRSRRQLEEDIEFLNESIQQITGKARKIKNWTTHDLIHLKPLTFPQSDMIEHFVQGQHLCAFGSAGTGKTLIALFLALQEAFDDRSPIDHVKIVRSAVPSRDQGFLPGTREEKERIYELPYHDICSFLLDRKSSYDDLKRAGIIDFMTTSYVRGLTWDNSIVIIDEGQNLSFSEINSIITRLGKNSRLIFIGDLPQCDLNSKFEETGMSRFLRIVDDMDNIEKITFTSADIVRSKFVKSWIEAVERVK